MDPIHLYGNAQHINIRLYFDKDENREKLLSRISEMLDTAPALVSMISAYELVSDGFGRLVPDERPIA